MSASAQPPSHHQFGPGDLRPPSGTQSGLRIAVLLDHLNLFSGGYEAQLRDCLHANCRTQGHHLLLLYGGLAEPPEPMSVADNALYELLRPDSVDGIIVVSSLLSAYCGPEGVSRLVDRYKPAKLCSIGVELPGVPSIVLDNQPGMEAVVEHLVVEHGCRHFAFLEGTPKNPEADVRLLAFRSVLERHGLSVNPALIARGHFRTNLAKLAMEEILARGTKVDAVVAANDEMAAGAVEVLRQRGFRVPQDIAVTGFDDILLARLVNPPLTTVAQPLDSVADVAIGLLKDQLAGREVPACTRVAAKFVRRQSCGCHLQRRQSTVATNQGAKRAAEPIMVANLAPALAEILRMSGDGTAAAARLVSGLQGELAGESGALSQVVAELARHAGDDSERHQELQTALDYVRAELRELSNLSVERALYDSLVLVAHSNATAQLQHRLRLDENYLRLLSVGERASLAVDLASLRDALVEGLPKAGAPTVFLSLVSDGDSAELVPMVCLLDGRPCAADDTPFPARYLVPPPVFELGLRHTFLVFPLVIDSRLLGVIAFSHSEGTNAYAAFRNEIATALRGIHLRRELVQESMLRERSVQERLATSKRMESLSVLAGGVAHDLNNALGPLIAIPDLILAQLDEANTIQAPLPELRSDVQTMKAASLRAAQTIKDLLTLGRQGRMLKEALDVNRVVQSCLTGRGGPRDETGKLSLELASSPLMVRGAESQLARAVGNLVRNAVEAVHAGGHVAVKTASVRLADPLVGYETVPPGSYATITVKDDGCGIPPHELGRIFEPFFTRKRAGDNSGSGLGLAIVHGVVKEHDGFVDVESTLNLGTTITLYLPSIAALAQEQPSVPSAPRGSARVLVVDDEPMQLRTCRRALTRLGYQVETQESGARTYELFQQAASAGQSPCDLLIIDVALQEELDGLEIADRIRRLFPAQRMLIMSGHTVSDRGQQVIAQGVPWLIKPYTLDSLARAVHDVLHVDAAARGDGA